MNTSHTTNDENGRDPRDISRWARNYAQNRALGKFYLAVIWLAVFGGMWLLPRAIREASAENRPLLVGAAIAVLACVLVVNIVIAVPSWSARLTRRLDALAYAREGNVSVEANTLPKMRWFDKAVAIAFGSCILLMVVFGDAIPSPYAQPASALFVVPFLCFIILRHSRSSYLTLLAPLLYTWHAVLILCGLPVAFTGDLAPLTVPFSVIGTMMITFLVMHLYSRVALRKLRTLAQAGADIGGEAEEEGRDD